MNIFNKIYCRVFQGCFRLILPLLPYRKPQVYESNTDIINILNKENLNRVLIVTDKGIVKVGLVDYLIDLLKDNNIHYVVYDNTVPNPTISNIEEARQVYLDNSLQAIIAIGGGSPIDLAKVVGARIVRPKKSVKKMKGLLKINKKIPTLIAIPTTSGTGSEVTLAAVITDDSTHHKYPINDFSLIPSYAILDYHNTLKLPKSITATTGMDALTHAVEAYIGNSNTKETKKMALEATRLIVKNLKECYINGDNLEARKNMLYASYYAGIAFSKAYVGYVHAIAHTLGGKYNIAHGLANAIILPIVLEEYKETVYKKLSELAIYSEIANKEDDIELASKKFIKWIYEMNKFMDIPLNINNILEEDIDELVVYALKEANPLYPVPKLMGKEEFKDLYIKIKNKR